MEITLKVDNREKAIHEHINAVFCEKPMFCVTINSPEFCQLEIGDFVIIAQNADMSQSQVLAIIERKTLEDYAASLKDGRMMNTEKLLKLREESGCQVYYLIEGNINTGYDTKICGIEYYKILANIRDAQILHNINIINTSNKLYTARELKFILERYTKSYESISSKVKITGSFDNIVEKCKPTEIQILRNEIVVAWTNLLSKKDDVKTKITPSNKATIIASLFTLRKWLAGEIKEEELIEIKTNGRRLDGWQIEMLSKPMTLELQLKALVCIKGISKDFAKRLLEETSIKDIISDPETEKLVIMGKNRLGKAKRTRIINVFKSRVKISQ